MPASLQTSFADALLNAERPIPHGVIAHNTANPARRFGVYRNNVVTGLVKVLGSRFPVVEKIVGDEFFAAMARIFVTKEPPRSPLLATYGEDFPAFVAAFEPARDLLYLADVARLEAARTRAYHAADATPVEADRFGTLDGEVAEHLRFALHPSIQIVRSPFPIVTIWAMNSGERQLAPIETWCGEDAVVARPYLDVQVRTLPPGGAAFLLALAADRSLGEAAAAALADDPDFDLTCNLAGLIGSGLARDIIVPEPEEPPVAMTHVSSAVTKVGSGPTRIVGRAIATLDGIPYWSIALAARIFPAAVFWQSGETKVAGWHLKPSAVALFENEYQLPLIDPSIAAHASAFAEHVFPVLLVIGFATRFSALALLIMTAVIEIFVYPGAWPTHGVWATCFLILIARGAGSLSLDHLIARKYAKIPHEV